MQEDDRAGRCAGFDRRVQPSVQVQPVARGDRLRHGADAGDHRAVAAFGVDALPFARPRVDQFDGSRQVGSLDGHRDHRAARADGQLARDRPGQRNRLAQRVIGVFEYL